MTDPSADNDLDRVIRVIMARCGDVLSDEDLATITQLAEPLGELLPVEVGAEIMEVLDAVLDRLEALERAVNSQRSDPGDDDSDPVETCRKAMIDFDIETKRLVMTELDRWVSLEEASHEPLQ